MVTYLCSTLHRDTEAIVTVETLRRALKERSWLVIFDGLDEVPSDVKDSVASEVVAFIRQMTPVADLLALCTSRPQGYSGQFDVLDGAVVDLVDLPPALALECATRVAVIDRPAVDSAKAKALLERAVESPVIRELMTTPLQAHILAVLVRNGQRPPERKWDLYNRFYEVLREREANRDLPDHTRRDVLQRDPALIDAVHHRLGFALHTRAERASGADASLTKVEFATLIESVVREARREADVPTVVDAILRATTERLVRINTPDQGDRVRFDIRAIQEFFAAELIYVDTTAEVLRERLDLIAGDSHWREVVQFVLGALTAQRRATEWTVALDVLRSINDGDRRGMPPALSRRFAGGALHVALFLANGAAEGSRKTRDQLRSLLEPITGTTDESLLAALKAVSAPESSTWLRGWVLEAVRRLQASASNGALRVLAQHSTDAIATQDFLILLESLETRQVASLLEECWQEDRFDRDPQKRRPWISAAIDSFLQRSDCLSVAPEFVSRLLNEAWLRGRSTRNKRISQNSRVVRSPSTILTQLCTSPEITRLSAAETARPRLVSNSHLLVEGFTNGLLGWISLLFDLDRHGGVERTHRALSALGQRWDPVIQRPRELVRRLPIPRDRRISPYILATRIWSLTDELLDKAIEERQLGDVPLEASTQPALYSFVHSEAALLETVRVEPRAAWIMWCIRFHNRHLAEPRHLYPAPAQLSLIDGARDAIARAFIDDPLLAQGVHDDLLLAGLIGLKEHTRAALTALTRLDMRWALKIAVGHLSLAMEALSELELSLPRDARFLPLLTSAFLTTTINTLKRPMHVRDMKAGTDSLFDKLPIDGLTTVAQSTDSSVEERAAALLLLGLHPKVGVMALAEAKPTLIDLARAGTPVVAGVALAAERSGRWADSVIRQLIEELLAVSDAAAGSTSRGLTGMDAIVQTLRERSAAPLTCAGALTRWLEVSSWPS